MQVEIITIGDEILIGQIIDSNSAWIAKELNKIGIRVKQITSVSDDEQHILNALTEAEERAEIILITGGLGPTKDDITKKTLAKYFNSQKMVFHQPTLDLVTSFFAKRNLPLSELNKLQALVPDNCEVITNDYGTAPCMLFRKANKLVFSMPGVPFEMKALMENKVLPLIAKNYQLPSIFHKTIITSGIGESFLADKIADIEESLPAYIKMAYLPKLGTVRLRLSTAIDATKEVVSEVDSFALKIKNRIPEFWVADTDIAIEKAILDIMQSEGLTLSVAESCTGGYLSQLITQHAGSSKVFAGGGVVYSNQLKVKLLDVKPQTLDSFGAVSEETVTEMVTGALQNFKTDYAIAITGIAGPDGGTADKPVGTVWIAVANHQEIIKKQFAFSNKRAQNIELSAIAALNLLLRLIKQKHA